MVQTAVTAKSDRKPSPKLRRLTATLLPKTELQPGSQGRLQAGTMTFPCALGIKLSRSKREGDLASPTGRFRLIGGYFRPIGPRPAAPWPLRRVRDSDGWCDDPLSPAYNQPLSLPSRYSCERLWRDDGLYDVIVVLDYNLRPRRKGRGSAIFLHCARPGFAPTAGCIALKPSDLRKLLPRLAKNTVLVVG